MEGDAKNFEYQGETVAINSFNFIRKENTLFSKKNIKKERKLYFVFDRVNKE